MNRKRLAGGFLILVVALSALSAVEARDLFLNIYVDDTRSGTALVVGNVDDPSGLPFLNSSQHIYEENGQVYAITTTLLTEIGSGWRVDFPASGTFDEYHAVFYIPGGFELEHINCTTGLEVLSSRYNGSLIMDVQGFDVSDPAVSLMYRVP